MMVIQILVARHSTLSWLVAADMARTPFISVLLIITFLSLEASAKDEWNEAANLHLSYNMMKHVNLEIHSTKLFRHQSGLHVRHGLGLDVLLKYSAKQQYCDKLQPFMFKLMQNDVSVHKWTQKPRVQRSSQNQDEILEFNLHVSRSIPIGQYTLNVEDPCSA